MRLLSALVVLALVVSWLSFARAADDSPDAAVTSPDRAAKLPLGRLWPGVLLVGYISLDLKRQLRRRGHLRSDRRDTFSDLISLDRPAPRRGGEPKEDSHEAPPAA